MELPATPENRVLASAVNSRIRSDARRHNAQAAFYRLAGWGVLCGLLGAGIGGAFYGYSYLNPPNSTENVAGIVADALSRVTFRTEGTVKLDPESTLQLANARPEVPTPTAAQLGTGATPDSKAAVATNFTVFKNVPFGQGQVVTGWNFNAGDQKSPTHQYCYYSEQIEGNSKVTVDLGENGRSVPQFTTRAKVDTGAAYKSCVWFKGAT